MIYEDFTETAVIIIILSRHDENEWFIYILVFIFPYESINYSLSFKLDVTFNNDIAMYSRFYKFITSRRIIRVSLYSNEY